jgi:biopolymer transport protein ExbB
MFNTANIPAVQVTFWLLASFSVTTWALILIKGVQSFRVVTRNRRFAKQFWSASNLQAAADIATPDGPLTRIAAAGFTALRGGAETTQEQDLEHSWDRQEQLERNLKQQITRERRTLDAGLAVLATIGSTAPFVGLFGTVWGIMNAMGNIAKLGTASIDVVAGPIGEALVATAIGLAVAIPAVVAYNYFLRRLKSATADFDEFAHDFLNLAQRATFRIERPVRPGDVRAPARVVGVKPALQARTAEAG